MGQKYIVDPHHPNIKSGGNPRTLPQIKAVKIGCKTRIAAIGEVEAVFLRLETENAGNRTENLFVKQAARG